MKKQENVIVNEEKIINRNKSRNERYEVAERH